MFYLFGSIVLFVLQNEKQTILHCRNRYNMKNKQYYTDGTGTK
jgi:hypothetical protein